MSDYPKLRTSKYINGEFFEFNVDSVEEFDKILQDILDAGDELYEKYTGVVQLVTAKGIFTEAPSKYGNSTKSSGNSGGAASSSSDKDPRADDYPVPQCSHGKMKDIGREKGYKFRFYCASSSRDRNEQCKAEVPLK